MVYFRFAAGIIILFLLVLLAMGEPEPPLVAGSPAPQAKVESYDGRSWDLRGLYGRPILVNFWATWCGPCRYEIPHLVKLSEQYGERMQVVGLAVSSPAAAVAEAVKAFGIRYPVARVSDETVDLWKASAVPATYLLDAKGQVLWSTRGAMTESALQSAVEKHLFSP